MNSRFAISDYKSENKSDHLDWKSGTTTELYSTPIFNLEMVEQFREDGRKADFVRLKSADWVNICAVQHNSHGEDCLVMVRQYRHGNCKIALEMPGGLIDSGESPKTAAARELYEETGIEAGRLEKLGEACPNAAFMANTMHIFAAEDLKFTGSRKLDANEVIDVELVPIAKLMRGEVPEFCINGIMTLAWYFFSIWWNRQNNNGDI